MAKGFDRSKFGATQASAIKHQEEVQNELRPSGNNNSKSGYHEIDEGENKFRIYPFHPDGGGNTFYEPKTVSFLQINQQKRDANGKPIEGEFEIRNKPVFNAKVHGVDGDGNALKVDLVDAYLDILKKQLSEKYSDNDAEFKKQWGIATGFKSKTKIKPQEGRMMYADKFVDGKWVFDELQVGNLIKDQLNDLANQNEGEDDTLNLDPFSDPDTGIAIIIDKDSVAGGKDPKNYYKTSFEETRVSKAGGGFTTEANPTPLSDDQLENFMKVEPLYKKYRGVFTEKDMLLEVEGLERFDKVNAFGVIDSEEFIEALTYLSENVQPDKKNDEKPSEEGGKEVVEDTKVVKETPTTEPVEEEVEEDVVVTTVSETQSSSSDKLAAIRAKLKGGK